MNDRVTRKERGLIKGALRRVFSRSELRKAAIDASRIDYTDAARPRVTKWSRCPVCSRPTPTYLMECDHKIPVVKIDQASADMTADQLVDAIWCKSENLLAICKDCHKAKSKSEAAERRKLAKAKKVSKKNGR